jgi:hypothetical protein
VVGRCLVTVFVFSLLALAFIGQMPVVAAHNLGINPKSANYGILYACFGTGALIGAISIGTVFSRTSKADDRAGLPGRLLAALTPSPSCATAAGLLRRGRGRGLLLRLHHGLEHRLAGPPRRCRAGRVMALWIMGFGGTVALGNLLIGPVVSAVGITDVLIFGAGVALVLAWYADVRAPGLSALSVR